MPERVYDPKKDKFVPPAESREPKGVSVPVSGRRESPAIHQLRIERQRGKEILNGENKR